MFTVLVVSQLDYNLCAVKSGDEGWLSLSLGAGWWITELFYLFVAMKSGDKSSLKGENIATEKIFYALAIIASESEMTSVFFSVANEIRQ